ncbi:hypothetical protein LW980_17900, partial [Erwinia amylovora]|uniref:hypothetical protein n=1 Tax=Erwinia amylovora TaxID=552 RepID=UPI0020BE6CDD
VDMEAVIYLKYGGFDFDQLDLLFFAVQVCRALYILVEFVIISFFDFNFFYSLLCIFYFCSAMRVCLCH